MLLGVPLEFGRLLRRQRLLGGDVEVAREEPVETAATGSPMNSEMSTPPIAFATKPSKKPATLKNGIMHDEAEEVGARCPPIPSAGRCRSA